jgi:hypothetical protein
MSLAWYTSLLCCQFTVVNRCQVRSSSAAAISALPSQAKGSMSVPRACGVLLLVFQAGVGVFCRQDRDAAAALFECNHTGQAALPVFVPSSWAHFGVMRVFIC